jgi:hypothetical protein
MRFAIFVAVVAAHIVLLWLFPSLRRLVLLPVADEPAITPVFLPPLAEPMRDLPLERAEQVPWEAPLLYRSVPSSSGQGIRSEPPQQHAMREAERATKELRPAVKLQATSEPDAGLGPKATSSAPDWRAQAQVTAEANALQHTALPARRVEVSSSLSTIGARSSSFSCL